MQGRQAEVLFFRQLHRNDRDFLKGADSEVHYSIIQGNINRGPLMSGALCREQVKEKPSEKESGDFPLQSLLPLAEKAKNSRAQMNSSVLEERLTHAIIQKHPN